MAFLHPLTALATLAFLAYVASLGLRSRERFDRHLRPQHARLARYAYALMGGNLVAGTLSTWAWRSDMTVLGSMHFRLGLAITVLLSVTALVSRWVGAKESARILHPLLGLLALVLSGLQVFFGMSLLPL
jgi:polyferredoxin